MLCASYNVMHVLTIRRSVRKVHAVSPSRFSVFHFLGISEILYSLLLYVDGFCIFSFTVMSRTVGSIHVISRDFLMLWNVVRPLVLKTMIFDTSQKEFSRCLFDHNLKIIYLIFYRKSTCSIVIHVSWLCKLQLLWIRLMSPQNFIIWKYLARASACFSFVLNKTYNAKN